MSKQKDPRQLMSRRGVLAGAATLGLTAPFVLRLRPARANSGLVFVTWGGTYKSAVVAGLIKPFEAATGIEVTVVDTPDLAKVKAQMMTGNVVWDVFDAPGAMGASGSKDGFWEAFDPAIFPAADLAMPPPAKDLAPFYTWAGGVAWDPKRFPDGKHPRNFPEYLMRRPSQEGALSEIASAKHLKPRCWPAACSPRTFIRSMSSVASRCSTSSSPT